MLCLHTYASIQLLSMLVSQTFVSCVFKLGVEVLQVQVSMGGVWMILAQLLLHYFIIAVPSTGEATQMIFLFLGAIIVKGTS